MDNDSAFEAILRSSREDGDLEWRHFSNPLEVLKATGLASVMDVLAQVEELARLGKTCVGYISYEASRAFDLALVTHPPVKGFPLVAFGVFDRYEVFDELPAEFLSESKAAWQPSVSEDEYGQAVNQIKEYLANGDTYQVNYTIRLTSTLSGYSKQLFADLVDWDQPRYASYLRFDRWSILSLSPELFLQKQGSKIMSIPMKGTAKRGRFTSEDTSSLYDLKRSEKNRAENLMIVDMVRNDMGKIARTGSVKVKKLFHIEELMTVYQMTSRVLAETDATLVETLRALFPAASITGAPKKRAMEIIKELETEPRGVYTGCIGFVGPGDQAEFNVAIRTLLVNEETKEATYGVGGGIVWDSTAEDEYAECLAKAAVLNPPGRLGLFETIRMPGKSCEPESTDANRYESLQRSWDTAKPTRERSSWIDHLIRLHKSTVYFGMPYRFDEIHKVLSKLEDHEGVVRVTMDRLGQVSLELCEDRQWPKDRPVTLRICPVPVDSQDRFLFHKTTIRGSYERAKEYANGADEVILQNEHGHITEGTISHLAILKENRWLTPRLECGLLPGIYRKMLIKAGAVAEDVLTLQDLRDAEEIRVFNSVRGWTFAELID